jgi:D-aminoacyl-tRNA deacylase
MRAIVQRVTQARVVVRGEAVAQIGPGLLVYVAFHRSDGERDLAWMAEKIPVLRIFEDATGKMNRSVGECGGAVLVVSEFTLYGNARKGRRPSFDDSAPAEAARTLFHNFVDRLRGTALSIATGRFQEHMLVESVNDGPVTLLLDSPPAEPGGMEIQHGSITPQG